MSAVINNTSKNNSKKEDESYAPSTRARPHETEGVRKGAGEAQCKLTRCCCGASAWNNTLVRPHQLRPRPAVAAQANNGCGINKHFDRITLITQ